TAYLPPLSYMNALMSEPAPIEQMETFEKQTFRNRCTIAIHNAQCTNHKYELIRLTVPVGKVEHKQLTRDIQISYQTRWQHQHWITLVSAYQHTPYFMFFADYIRPFYEKEYKWLLDLNDELNATLMALLKKERPQGIITSSRSVDWSGQIWTDKHPWQTELSVLDTLFDE
ncbi:MAG: WbqC family protein, partial [Paludibacteraceae bacterium]|nr:WbqC family protein [Paludibacteraceae bacterium]